MEEHPQAKGVILGQHGLINWANDEKECYELTLSLIEKAAEYIEAKYQEKGGDAKAFGGQKYQALDETRAAKLLAASCRGCADKSVSKSASSVLFRTMRRFCVSLIQRDAARLAELGTSCPDHFLRTKIKPLYVDWNPQKEDAELSKRNCNTA